MSRGRKIDTFFEPGLLVRLRFQFGDQVNVDEWARWVRDFARRKIVQKPDGLLVNKVREEYEKAQRGVPQTAAARAAELERYARFQVDLYRLIAEQQLGPAAIAAYLEDARSALPLLNVRTIELLQRLGDTWPTPAPEQSETPRGNAA